MSDGHERRYLFKRCGLVQEAYLHLVALPCLLGDSLRPQGHRTVHKSEVHLGGQLWGGGASIRSLARGGAAGTTGEMRVLALSPRHGFGRASSACQELPARHLVKVSVQWFFRDEEGDKLAKICLSLLTRLRIRRGRKDRSAVTDTTASWSVHFQSPLSD